MDLESLGHMSKGERNQIVIDLIMNNNFSHKLLHDLPINHQFKLVPHLYGNLFDFINSKDHHDLIDKCILHLDKDETYLYLNPYSFLESTKEHKHGITINEPLQNKRM